MEDTQKRSLIYINSERIQEFMGQHPIDWANAQDASIGGPGDQAGMPPVPSVLIFLDALQTNKELFTQEEFFSRCCASWGAWYGKLPDQERAGLKAKAFRNFYPSMVNSLHAWAILLESCHPQIDTCVWNSNDDVAYKTDLFFKRGDKSVHADLFIGSHIGQSCRRYKRENRGQPDEEHISVPLTMDRPRTPGNMRWYTLRDFFHVIRALGMEPTITPKEANPIKLVTVKQPKPSPRKKDAEQTQMEFN